MCVWLNSIYKRTNKQKNKKHNKKQTDVAKVDEESIESILVNVCALGNKDALRFLVSTVPRDLLTDRLLLPNRYNENPVEGSVSSGQLSIVNELLSIGELIKRYRTDTAQLFRLIFHTFCRGNRHDDILDLVVTKLNLPSEKYIELLDYEYIQENRQSLPPGSYLFHRCDLIGNIGWYGANNGLKMLKSLIGEEEFVKRVFVPDNVNNTVFENVVRQQNVEMIKAILSYESVKETYKTNSHWMFRLVFWLFASFHPNEEVIDCVVSALKLSKEDIVPMLHNFDYREFNANNWEPNAWMYRERDIMSAIGWSGNDKSMKKLLDLIGEIEFEKQVFIPGYTNTTIVEDAARQNKVEMLKTLFGIESIKKVYLNDDYWIYRLVYWLQRAYKKEVCNFIVKELNLTEKKLLKYVNKEYEFKEKFVKGQNCNFTSNAVKYFVVLFVLYVNL